MKKLLYSAILSAAMVLSAQAGEVRVGGAAGVTGPIANLVKDIVEARMLAVAQINEQGGLLDGDTYKLILGDSACDPKAAVDVGNKLVNVEQVVAIIGPICSGATNAMTQSVTIPAGIVVLSDSASAPSITMLQDNDLVFRMAASDAYQGVALANLTFEAGRGKVAISYTNDDYNAALAGVFQDAFKKLGGEVVTFQAHEANKASYRSEVATMSAAGADTLVLFAYYGSSGITIIRNALETEAFDFFIGGDGMVSPELIAQIGAENLVDKGFYTTAASDDSTDAYKLFYEAAIAAGVNAKGPFVPNGYDTAFLMGLAIEVAGSADRGKIREALRAAAMPPGEIILPGEWAKAKKLIAEGKDINYVGAAGPADFDENGDVVGMFSLNTIQADGTWKTELLR